MQNLIECPKCGCTQLTASKKGFSGKNAVAGALLTGGIGFLAGTIGSNKTMLTCLACGFRYKAGEYSVEKTMIENERRAKLDASQADLIGGTIALLCISIIIASGITYLAYLSFTNNYYVLGAALVFINIIVFGFVYNCVEEIIKHKNRTPENKSINATSLSKPTQFFMALGGSLLIALIIGYLAYLMYLAFIDDSLFLFVILLLIEMIPCSLVIIIIIESITKKKINL